MRNLVLSILLTIFVFNAIPVHAQNSERKSVFKAALMSAIVPGSGELYVGAQKRGIFILGAGALIWGSYLYQSAQGGTYEDKYKDYAMLYANIPPDQGYSNDFYHAMTRYSTAQEYRQRRGDPPDGPEWDWTANPREWDIYREAYGDKQDTQKTRDQLRGAIFFTHLVSIVDAVIAARLHNRHLTADMEWDIKTNPFQESVTAAIVHRF